MFKGWFYSIRFSTTPRENEDKYITLSEMYGGSWLGYLKIFLHSYTYYIVNIVFICILHVKTMNDSQCSVKMDEILHQAGSP